MSAASPGALAIERVSVLYGEHPAVQDVSLTVSPGEVVALAGPNGSGKSTLLRAAAGLLPPSEGRVLLGDGTVVQDLSARGLAQRLAWMPQEEPPGDNVPLLEYVLYGRYARLPSWAGPSPSDHRAAAAALAEVDLADLTTRGVRELSGGERQRARLARTLAQETSVVLLDEPTAHLDIGHQLDALARIQRVAKATGRAVVLALHDLNLAARFADRIGVLSHGRLVAVGEPETVLSPELLERVWGVVAELRRDPHSGVPYLLPRLPLASHPSPTTSMPGPRVHLLAGGGSGASLLRRLVEAGFDVTAGVLPLFDTDATLAAELGVPSAVELPFAPIGPEARDRLRRLIAEAQAVVVAPFPVGPTNLANLEALVEAPARPPVLLLAQPAGTRWDYVDGRAEDLRRRLVDEGAASVGDVDAALRWLGERLRHPAPTRAPAEGRQLDR